MQPSKLSELCFFKVDRYFFSHKKEFDFSNYPRPHYCIGLVLKGSAVFLENGGTPIHLNAGELIFVPITARYTSCWQGTPEIEYISFHVCFEQPPETTELVGVKLQKLSVPDFSAAKAAFTYAAEHYNGTTAEQLQALGIFYRLLGSILPRLSTRPAPIYDSRINKAVEYLNLNLSANVSVPFLAEICHLSPSRFYECFKQSTGMTPIEYKNKACVTRATFLLIHDKERSIEEIATLLGFESEAYFRRVFKKITGTTPGHYRKSVPEV